MIIVHCPLVGFLGLISILCVFFPLPYFFTPFRVYAIPLPSPSINAFFFSSFSLLENFMQGGNDHEFLFPPTSPILTIPCCFPPLFPTLYHQFDSITYEFTFTRTLNVPCALGGPPARPFRIMSLTRTLLSGPLPVATTAV